MSNGRRATAASREGGYNRAMNMIAIYALKHPDTGEIRYIGKANDANARLKSHMRDARRRVTPLYCWINKLVAEGKAPVIDVLRTVSREEWKQAEREEIQLHRKKWNLLNLAEGGDEPYCDDKTRKKNAYKLNHSENKGVNSLLRYFGRVVSENLKNGNRDRALRFQELCVLIRKAPSPYREKFEQLGRARFHG